MGPLLLVLVGMCANVVSSCFNLTKLPYNLELMLILLLMFQIFCAFGPFDTTVIKQK